MKVNRFPKAAGLWWVQGNALALLGHGSPQTVIGITYYNEAFRRPVTVHGGAMKPLSRGGDARAEDTI